jgi:hypothetical protein
MLTALQQALALMGAACREFEAAVILYCLARLCSRQVHGPGAGPPDHAAPLAPHDLRPGRGWVPPRGRCVQRAGCGGGGGGLHRGRQGSQPPPGRQQALNSFRQWGSLPWWDPSLRGCAHKQRALPERCALRLPVRPLLQATRARSRAPWHHAPLRRRRRWPATSAGSGSGAATCRCASTPPSTSPCRGAIEPVWVCWGGGEGVVIAATCGMDARHVTRPCSSCRSRMLHRHMPHAPHTRALIPLQLRRPRRRAAGGGGAAGEPGGAARVPASHAGQVGGWVGCIAGGGGGGDALGGGG